MKILTATVVTSQQSVSSCVESKMITHMEGKVAFPRTFKQSPKGSTTETFDHSSKHPCLNKVKHLMLEPC